MLLLAQRLLYKEALNLSLLCLLEEQTQQASNNNNTMLLSCWCHCGGCTGAQQV